MSAYPEMYLSQAQKHLGEAFDYAINVCSMSPDDFINMFIASDAIKGIENGNAKYILGMSGIELLMEIVCRAKGKYFEIEAVERFGRTVEYWAGWALAYYQWHSNRRFSEILCAIPFRKLTAMYYPLHEADITKFAETMDSIVRDYYSDTALKRYRKILGYSQSLLSEESQVSLRSIQMYEQRKKDINKAGSETVYRLSKVLGVPMEFLLEK